MAEATRLKESHRCLIVGRHICSQLCQPEHIASIVSHQVNSLTSVAVATPLLSNQNAYHSTLIANVEVVNINHADGAICRISTLSRLSAVLSLSWVSVFVHDVPMSMLNHQTQL